MGPIGLIQWLGRNANTVSVAVRSFFYMGILLRWWMLTPEQLVGIVGFAEAMLAVFVATNTVSKDRVGERITEEVDRQMSGLPSTITPPSNTTKTGG